jgi:hypothetical protein
MWVSEDQAPASAPAPTSISPMLEHRGDRAVLLFQPREVPDRRGERRVVLGEGLCSDTEPGQPWSPLVKLE